MENKVYAVIEDYAYNGDAREIIHGVFESENDARRKLREIKDQALRDKSRWEHYAKNNTKCYDIEDGESYFSIALRYEYNTQHTTINVLSVNFYKSTSK